MFSAEIQKKSERPENENCPVMNFSDKSELTAKTAKIFCSLIVMFELNTRDSRVDAFVESTRLARQSLAKTHEDTMGGLALAARSEQNAIHDLSAYCRFISASIWLFGTKR